MDPVTHLMAGAAVGSFSSGGASLSNPAFIGCLIGSIIPDSDIVYQKWGDYVYLKNHRGVSHSLIANAFVSLGISALFNLLLPGSGLLNMVFWIYIGSTSHLLLDIFNSYGASVLWPLMHRKISLSLLLIVDPVLFITAFGIVLNNRKDGKYAGYLLAVFLVYLSIRLLMRSRVKKEIYKYFGTQYDVIQDVVILPSINSLFKWEFVVGTKEYRISGSIHIFSGNVKVRERFKKLAKN